MNGKFRGQLVAACAIDAHNWPFPVAYGVQLMRCSLEWSIGNTCVILQQILANSLKERYIYYDNLWPVSLTYSLRKHNYHLSQLHAVNPKVKDWFEKSHSKLWMRSKFNEICKVEYVNNNLAEPFNAKVRKIKGIHLVKMLDKVR